MPAAVDRDALHAALEESLRRRLDERIAAAHAYDDEFARLWRTASDGALGGKMLRPRLLVEAFRELSATFSSTACESAVELATSLELLHYAFLLHDDVIDGDLVRRGRPNMIETLRREAAEAASRRPRADGAIHWGRTGAILLGDLLLAGAVLGFAQADTDPATRSRLMLLLDRVISETVAGEFADVAFSDGLVAADLPAILRMTVRKTAVYSFELPLRSAAILSRSAPEAEEALAAAGRSIGLAYQLQDDMLSAFGDGDAHGKDPLTDLREGKETAIIAYARMTGAWTSIAPRFGAQDLTDAEASRIRRSLRECGAEQFVENLISEHLADAVSGIDDGVRDGTLPAGIRRVLLGLVARLEGRRS